MPARKAKSQSKPEAKSPPPPFAPRQDTRTSNLQRVVQHKRSNLRKTPPTLGDVLQPWYEKNVAKPGEKMGALIDLWHELVPPPLADQTRVIAFARSTLCVSARSAAVKAQVDALLRKNLLRALQAHTQGRIFRVKLSLDGSPLEECN